MRAPVAVSMHAHTPLSLHVFGNARQTDSGPEEVVLFDTQSDRFVQEGVLEKLGNKHVKWRTRWFRLQQGSLFYYKTQKDKKPIGEVVLQNCTVFRSAIKRQHEFTICTSNRDWLLCAKDDEEANQWVEVIKSCITSKGPGNS